MGTDDDGLLGQRLGYSENYNQFMDKHAREVRDKYGLNDVQLDHYLRILQSKLGEWPSRLLEEHGYEATTEHMVQYVKGELA